MESAAELERVRFRVVLQDTGVSFFVAVSVWYKILAASKLQLPVPSGFLTTI
jgi:hypothetical protein